MQLMLPKDHSFFSDINKAIYIYFVSLTSVFVRPDGAKLWGMTPEGVMRYQFIHLSKLDHRKIHSRWCEIECHRAGADIWVKHYEDEDVQRSIRELTEQTSVDVSSCDCYYAAIQVNFYMPKGEDLAKKEVERFHQAINDGLSVGAVALENYRILKVARGDYVDVMDKGIHWLEGYDHIIVVYHILIADIGATNS